MIRFFKKLINNELVKNFLTLLSGSVIAQAILFFIIPLLSRIYTDEMFGMLTLFTSIALTLKHIIGLQYELAILLPKRDKDAINILVLNFLIMIAITIILLLIAIFFKNPINQLFNNNGLGNYIYLLPFSVFFLGSYNALNYWNNRQKDFKKISITKVSKSAVIASTQVGIGFSKFQFVGLIPGLIAGQFTASLHLFFISLKKIKLNLKHLSIKRMCLLAKKHKDIPQYITFTSLINTLSNRLSGILFPKFFGLAQTGQFGMAEKIIKAPLGLITQSINQIFFNKASEIHNFKPEKFYSFVKNTYLNLLKISVIIFPIIFIFSFFFEFLLGEKWTEAGLYSRILLPWLFLTFLNSPVSSLIIILNKQKTIVIYQILLLLFRISALWAGHHFFDDLAKTLGLYVAISVVFNIFLSFFFLISSKKFSYKNLKK
jgi:O-antigen/teichoic acid export membrane protein